MDNKYVEAVVYAAIATVGAFLLNLVFDYTDNSVTTWALTFVAFVVGTYIAGRMRERRKGARAG